MKILSNYQRLFLFLPKYYTGRVEKRKQNFSFALFQQTHSKSIKLTKVIKRLALLFVLFAESGTSFAQVQPLIDNLSEAMKDTVPFMSTVGLNWSSNYVGQFIGSPYHWGAGISMGAVLIAKDEIQALARAMGQNAGSAPFFDKKELVPLWAASVRIGGILGAPISVGFKFGMVPEIPIWSDLNYRLFTYGADIDVGVYVSESGGPLLTLGISYSKVESGATCTFRIAIPGIPIGTQAGQATLGSQAAIIWVGDVFKLKFFIAQPLATSGITMFLGLNGGVSINSIGLTIRRYENLKSSVGIAADVIAGVGFEIGWCRLDVSFMTNFLTFDPGVSIGIRYQQ